MVEVELDEESYQLLLEIAKAFNNDVEKALEFTLTLASRNIQRLKEIAMDNR
jgi:hypothetical protein